MSRIIPQDLNPKKKKAVDNPRTAYMREVKEYLQSKDLCNMYNPFVDPTPRGYRIKLFRGTEGDIPKVRKALDEGGYTDVEVVMRGVDKDTVSVIVPYSS